MFKKVLDRDNQQGSSRLWRTLIDYPFGEYTQVSGSGRVRNSEADGQDIVKTSGKLEAACNDAGSN